MDAERLEQQVASVERGIVFLKREHLVMLSGLQREITHLKRRCHGKRRCVFTHVCATFCLHAHPSAVSCCVQS